jgi:hypothetical protein
MAAEFIGAQWTVAATATSLTTILGVRKQISELHVRLKDAAANPVFIGGSTVTNVPANAFAEASSGATPVEVVWRPSNGCRFDSDTVFLVGTVAAANVAHISVIA